MQIFCIVFLTAIVLCLCTASFPNNFRQWLQFIRYVSDIIHRTLRKSCLSPFDIKLLLFTYIFEMGSHYGAQASLIPPWWSSCLYFSHAGITVGSHHAWLKISFFLLKLNFASTHVIVRGQPCTIGGLLTPLHGFWRSNPGGQACMTEFFTYWAISAA